jgi:hypothetical protein
VIAPNSSGIALRTAQIDVRAVRRRIDGAARSSGPLREPGHRDAALEPGQRSAEAEMRAEAEGQVPVRTGGVEAAGVGEYPPLILDHRSCGHPAAPVLVCEHCREPIDPRDVDPPPGPGFEPPGESRAADEQAS